MSDEALLRELETLQREMGRSVSTEIIDAIMERRLMDAFRLVRSFRRSDGGWVIDHDVKRAYDRVTRLRIAWESP